LPRSDSRLPRPAVFRWMDTRLADGRVAIHEEPGFDLLLEPNASAIQRGSALRSIRLQDGPGLRRAVAEDGRATFDRALL
jgi:hypothetical protein